MRFAVIGSVRYSLSPYLHTRVFKKLKLKHTYIPLEIKKSELEKKVEQLRVYNGLNVTIPLKQEILKHVDLLDKEAERIGAVNVVKFKKYKMVGHNTDGIGFVNALEEVCEPFGNKVLLLGSGGAARAIAFSLAKNNYIVIANRTLKNAVKLSEDIGKNCEAIPLEKIENEIKDADVLVNSTPIGMHPEDERMPLERSVLAKLPANAVVCDVIYNPIETKLLRTAKSLGLKTLNGIGMFVWQAALSQKIWGIEPPIKFMKEVVVKKLEEK